MNVTPAKLIEILSVVEAEVNNVQAICLTVRLNLPHTYQPTNLVISRKAAERLRKDLDEVLERMPNP
jgi:hypothetical protein